MSLDLNLSIRFWDDPNEFWTKRSGPKRLWFKQTEKIINLTLYIYRLNRLALHAEACLTAQMMMPLDTSFAFILLLNINQIFLQNFQCETQNKGIFRQLYFHIDFSIQRTCCNILLGRVMFKWHEDVWLNHVTLLGERAITYWLNNTSKNGKWWISRWVPTLTIIRFWSGWTYCMRMASVKCRITHLVWLRQHMGNQHYMGK